MFLVIMIGVMIALSVLCDYFDGKANYKLKALSIPCQIAGMICFLITGIVVCVTAIKPPFNNNGSTDTYPVCDYSGSSQNYSVSYIKGDAIIMCVSDSVVLDENIDKPIVVITKPGTIDDKYKFFFPWLSFIELEKIEEVLHIPVKED